MARWGILAWVGVSALAASCSDDDGALPGTCGLDLESRFESNFGDARIDNLLEAAGTFSATANELDADVQTACNNIATDLGAATATDTTTACDNASAAIQGVIDANAEATLVVEVTPAVCTVDAQAVAECTGMCDANFDATATPPTCEGGMLSGMCTGMCEGACTVEGSGVTCEGSCTGMCSGTCSATVEATCTGNCMGQCDGTCSAMDGDGNCMGECTGTCRGMCTGTIEGGCTGECSGSCMGSCRTDLMASCEGRCTGSCDVDFEAPRCEGGEVNVQAEAECSASCEADASFEAECTEPEVVATFTGSATVAEDLDALAATLRGNLPVLLAAIEKGGVMAGASVEFASELGGAVSAAASTGLEAADCVRLAIAAQVAAAARVSVSVEASVEVSATATGSASSS